MYSLKKDTNISGYLRVDGHFGLQKFDILHKYKQVGLSLKYLFPSLLCTQIWDSYSFLFCDIKTHDLLNSHFFLISSSPSSIYFLYFLCYLVFCFSILEWHPLQLSCSSQCQKQTMKFSVVMLLCWI